MATRGVLPTQGDKKPERFKQDPYSSIDDNAETTAIALWGYLVRGRLAVFTNLGGGCHGPLMESKLDAVTQKGVIDPEVLKTRYISDPRFEVNSRITNDRHHRCGP